MSAYVVGSYSETPDGTDVGLKTTWGPGDSRREKVLGLPTGDGSKERTPER